MITARSRRHIRACSRSRKTRSWRRTWSGARLASTSRFWTPASLPEKPYNQKQKLLGLVAGPLGGLMLGLLFAGFLEYRDSTFKTDADVVAVLSLPVLAQVPLMSAAGDGPTRQALALLEGIHVPALLRSS